MLTAVSGLNLETFDRHLGHEALGGTHGTPGGYLGSEAQQADPTRKMHPGTSLL